MKEKENLTIPSYNSLHTGTLQLLQIAFANDNEEGNESLLHFMRKLAHSNY